MSNDSSCRSFAAKSAWISYCSQISRSRARRAAAASSDGRRGSGSRDGIRGAGGAVAEGNGSAMSRAAPRARAACMHACVLAMRAHVEQFQDAEAGDGWRGTRVCVCVDASTAHAAHCACVCVCVGHARALTPCACTPAVPVVGVHPRRHRGAGGCAPPCDMSPTPSDVRHSE